jgi:hypothetical protein
MVDLRFAPQVQVFTAGAQAGDNPATGRAAIVLG